jgi:hypothetical protein
MKLIPLTQGKYAIVDDEDFDYLSQFKWYADRHKRKNLPDGFAAARKVASDKARQTTILMHRDIMGVRNRTIKVDHWNHDELDNRRDNLRVCTQSENCLNKRVKPRDVPRGVTFCKDIRKYRSQMELHGKHIHLGYFDDPELAALVYQEAHHKLSRQFSIFNRP